MAASNQAFDAALVHWRAYTPTPQPYELMIYFVPDRSKSIALEIGAQASSGTSGFTAWTGAGAVSEVYSSAFGQDASLAAALAFHELMHNKLRLNDQQLHPMGGLAAASVGPGTQITPQNTTAMGAALKKPAPQYAAGLTSAVNGRNDPMSRYYTI